MFDVIGTLTIPGQTDDEGNWIVFPVILDGWHVNTTTAILDERPDLEPYVVTPETLMRVWAGDDPDNPTMTVALRFADEASSRAKVGIA